MKNILQFFIILKYVIIQPFFFVINTNVFKQFFFSLNNQTTRVLCKTKTTTQRSDGRDALVRIDTKNDLMPHRNAIEIVSVNIFIIDKMS